MAVIADPAGTSATEIADPAGMAVIADPAGTSATGPPTMRRQLIGPRAATTGPRAATTALREQTIARPGAAPSSRPRRLPP